MLLQILAVAAAYLVIGVSTVVILLAVMDKGGNTTPEEAILLSAVWPIIWMCAIIRATQVVGDYLIDKMCFLMTPVGKLILKAAAKITPKQKE